MFVFGALMAHDEFLAKATSGSIPRGEGIAMTLEATPTLYSHRLKNAAAFDCALHRGEPASSRRHRSTVAGQGLSGGQEQLDRRHRRLFVDALGDNLSRPGASASVEAARKGQINRIATRAKALKGTKARPKVTARRALPLLDAPAVGSVAKWRRKPLEPDETRSKMASRAQCPSALTIASVIFLASPNSIIVLSRKKSSFSTPA